MKSKLLSKRVLVLFILLLGFSPLSQAFAQFGITGTVTDWARNPIIGATVVFRVPTSAPQPISTVITRSTPYLETRSYFRI